MKVLLKILLVMLVAIGAVSCRRHHLQDREIHVPAMKNEACALIVRNALVDYSKLPNMENSIRLESIVTDLDRRIVSIRYDSMKTEIKNLEHAISKAGFQANEIPADPAAAKRLPPECK